MCHLSHLWTCLRLGEEKLLREKEEVPFFRESDIAFFCDGRNPSNSRIMSSGLASSLKLSPLLFSRSQAMVTVRLMYHGKEFQQGASLGVIRKTCLTQTAPDPLESLIVLQTKGYKLSQRALPAYGTESFSRAWTGLSLRDIQDMEISCAAESMVPDFFPKNDAQKKAADAPEAAEVKIKTDPEKQPDSAVVAESEPEDESVSEGADGVVMRKGVPLWPWEVSEDFWLSAMCGFHLKSPSECCVVDFTPGIGLAALAAIRGRYRYVGFVSTSVHEKFLRQFVMYKIVSEMILNVDPAAWNTRKRVLTRENSLTGESTTAESAKSEPDMSKVQEPDKKRPCSSSSSSS